MIASGLASKHDAVLAAERTEPRPTFAQLYESQFSFVWRSVRRLGVAAATMDDVVQEVFVVVHRNLAKFEGRSSSKTWLFGIVLNVVRAHRRGLRAEPLQAATAAIADPERVADPAAGPLELATKAEAVRVVDALLDSLDDEKREVFVLAELEQMSAPDIAHAIGIPLNTVYSRLRLARQEFSAAAVRHRARDEWRTR
jgi:RNA polymerase sigma-70 factor (ECF subfamily)